MPNAKKISPTYFQTFKNWLLRQTTLLLFSLQLLLLTAGFITYHFAFNKLSIISTATPLQWTHLTMFAAFFLALNLILTAFIAWHCYNVHAEIYDLDIKLNGSREIMTTRFFGFFKPVKFYLQSSGVWPIASFIMSLPSLFLLCNFLVDLTPMLMLIFSATTVLLGLIITVHTGIYRYGIQHTQMRNHMVSDFSKHSKNQSNTQNNNMSYFYRLPEDLKKMAVNLFLTTQTPQQIQNYHQQFVRQKKLNENNKTSFTRMFNKLDNTTPTGQLIAKQLAELQQKDNAQANQNGAPNMSQGQLLQHLQRLAGATGQATTSPTTGSNPSSPTT